MMAFFSLTGWAADLSKGTIIAPSPYYGTALTGITPEVRNEAGTLLASGTDYTLDGYFSDANCTNEVTFNDVIDHIGDTYYIKVSGINLYKNSLIASFKVKKMPLTVTLADKTKTYLENDPAYEITSVVDENADAAPTDIVNAIVISREEGNTVKWNAAGTAVQGYAYTASLDNDKYSIKSTSCALTINPKDFTAATVTVTVTANLTYNGAAQKATVTVKDNALNQNLAETTDFVITWSNNTNASDAAVASVKAAAKGNYDATDAAIVENFSIKKAPLLVTPNPTKVYDGEATMPAVAAAAFSYQGFVDDMTADNVSVTVGKLEYKNAALMIALKESAYDAMTKVYDGQPVSITLNKESGLIISPATATVDLSELTLTIVDNSANVGTYRLELSGAKAANYDITYVPSRYKITQRPLSVNIYDQTFVKGSVPTLNTDLFKVADPGEGTGLVTGEKAGDVFQLALDKTAVITVDAEGKITSDAGTYANAIIAIAASAKFANYNIMATNGKAVILGEAIVLNDAAAITTTAQDNATVNFSARSLQTEKWNPLVLPFDVTVEKLSAAFGYAVIDVLNDEKGTDGNVYFKLKVSGTIPANTLFLIYPSDTKTDLNQVVFTEVNVVAVTGEENVSVKDAGENKFWGTYKSTPIYGSNFRYMSKGTWFGAGNYTEAKPADIKPLRGYLELPAATAARAIIFIDEPDGTTTAIQAVSGDKIGSDIIADGWYTLGGMKLQGAPTQKGVYINNGKKVVVK